MSATVINKINRLKGMIDSMELMADMDEQLDHPMIDKLSSMINEIVEECEGIFNRKEYANETFKEIKPQNIA